MVGRKDFLIVAVDILMTFVILFLLGFLAIHYDANKGLGEQDYIKINNLLTKEENIQGDFHSLSYIAIVLKENSFDLYKYEASRTHSIGTFRSLKEFVEKGMLDRKLIYVIYEVEKSLLLSQLIRLFAVENIPIGIAQVEI